MSTESDVPAPGSVEMVVRVMGLAVMCPFSQDNPGHCQLCEIRSRPMAERVAWVRSQSADDLRRIAANHQSCLEALERLTVQSGDERS